jgi:cytochrome P450
MRPSSDPTSNLVSPTVHIHSPSPDAANQPSYIVNPDRWLNINPTTYEYMPFGAGQRACLGREKAQAEAALVIARLAERFETLESEDQRAFYAKQGISTCNGNGCRVKLT